MALAHPGDMWPLERESEPERSEGSLERVVRAQRETFMTPTKIEYEIGSTIYGQPLRLVRSKSTGGQMEWILARDQADQRDDSAVIAGLTKEHILKMAEAVKGNVP